MLFNLNLSSGFAPMSPVLYGFGGGGVGGGCAREVRCAKIGGGVDLNG